MHAAGCALTHMHMHAQARPWRPTLLIRLSFLLHALLPIVLLAWTQGWPWILASLCANHLLLAAVGMWPRSTWLGPNWTRLPPAASARGAIALTIDDGPHPDVTPQVLDLLDRYGIKASFFCIGAAAERYPELKASPHFRDLQQQLTDAENRATASRRFYNLATDEYNSAIKQFPGNRIAHYCRLCERRRFARGIERVLIDEPVAIRF